MESTKMQTIQASMEAQERWVKSKSQLIVMLAQAIVEQVMHRIAATKEISVTIKLEELIGSEREDVQHFINSVREFYKEVTGGTLTQEHFVEIIADAFANCWQGVLYESNRDLNSNKFEAEVTHLDDNGQPCNNYQAAALRISFREVTRGYMSLE